MFTLSLESHRVDVRSDHGSISVRSLRGYSDEYDAADPLHAFLDSLESHVVRALASGEEVGIETVQTPKAYAACEALFAEPVGESPLETLIKGLLQ